MTAPGAYAARMPAYTWLYWMLAALVVPTACDSPGGGNPGTLPVPVDTATETGADAGADAGVDVGSDATDAFGIDGLADGADGVQTDVGPDVADVPVDTTPPDTSVPDVPQPPALGTAFASGPTQWSVPDSMFGSVGGNYQVQGEDWTTIDMDGDDRPDLVWTGSFSSHADAGSNWRVYKNTGASFAASPTVWAVPDGIFGSTFGHYQIQGEDWSTMDLTGDGLPDLVWTGSFSSHTDAGSNWRVYVNNGAGFAGTPTQWAIPDSMFGSIGGTYQVQGEDWTTIDMDGDGLPDLVWTGAYASHTDIGSNWRVYKNTGSGFAATPTQWPVPDGRFGSTYGNYQIQGDDWSTIDIDGDDLPDLVWTGSFGSHTDAGPNWRVYKNSGIGFASIPTQWAVVDTLFGSIGGNYQVQGDDWTTLDLDGDDLADLVWTGSFGSHTDIGSNWRLYRNTGGGFVSSPAQWAVPDSVFGSTFGHYQIQGEDWSTMDLDGDGRPDLVWTGSFGAHNDVGWNWRVYLNVE